MIDDLLAQLDTAAQEVGLNGATGFMLNFYARRVGLVRFPNEPDASLLQRIIAQLNYRLDPASLASYLRLYNSQVYGVYELGGNSVAISKTFQTYNYTRQPVTASFSRPTAAYSYDGQQIAANTPVFTPTTKGQAVFVWQGTANVLTANQSSAETDLTGYVAGKGATLAQDTSYAWHGTKSVKVTTPGLVAGEGVRVSFTGSANTVYAGQVRIRGSGTVQVQLIDTANKIYGTVKTIALTNNAWQEINNVVVYCGGGNVDFLITTTTAQAVTFWVDGLQVEAGSYSTPWTLGGGSRAAETLVYPTTNTFYPKQGCLRVALLQHQGTYDPQGYRYVFAHSTDGVNNVLAIRHTPDNFWQVWISDNLGNSLYLSVPDRAVQPYPAGSMYAFMPNLIQFAVNWSGNALEFYINGVLMVSASTPPIPQVAASNFYIGSWIDGTGQINGEVFKVDISPKPRQKEYISTYDAVVDDTLLMDGLSWFKAGYVTNDLTAYIPSNYEGAAFYLALLGSGQGTSGPWYDQAYFDNLYYFASGGTTLQQYINRSVLDQCKAAGIIPLFL
ncbi:MAG: hypothetical protein ACPLXA_00715 [Moorellaceae bacterium]